MVALGLRYLMGWAMAASDGQEMQQAEWPPHPDRVFLALAAAWFESGEDSAQGAALRWLEALPPPAIAASEARIRGSGRRNLPVVSYVPVNDSRRGNKLPDSDDLKKLKGAGLDVLPEFRSRQPRSFPVAVPDSPDVFLIWPDADPASHLAALQALASQVTHVGHSASLVQMWVEIAPPQANWQPGHGVAALIMHVSYRGRLDGLRQSMNREAWIAWHDLKASIRQAKEEKKSLTDKAKKQVVSAKLKRLESWFAELGDAEPVTSRPIDAPWQPYSVASEPIPAFVRSSLFEQQLVIVGLHGRRLPLASTLRLTEALRGVLLKACPVPIPEWISGHQPDTRLPTRQPHLALFPLPFVGREHADGHIMGLALALPRTIEPGHAAHCLNPLFWDMDTGAPRNLHLFDGSCLDVSAQLELRGTSPHALRNPTWTRPSRVWASVTPIVLDRHFKGSNKWDQAAESLKRACERIDLPRPQTVMLNTVSSVEGAPPTHGFPALRRNDGSRKQHTHATLIFEKPVAGPVLLGAGRFRGYGLFRPMDGAYGHA